MTMRCPLWKRKARSPERVGGLGGPVQRQKPAPASEVLWGGEERRPMKEILILEKCKDRTVNWG